jgi:hypothetical protein
MSTAIYTHADWPDLQAAVAAIDPGRREADAT